MSENIDDLLVTIGGDLSGLTQSFQKTADHIKEMAKAVSGVNFENLVKNGQVVARVIDSLRTQTVKGFGEMAAKTKEVAVAVGVVGTQMEALSSQVQTVSASLNTLPFGRMVILLEQIAANTNVVSRNFKGLRKDVQLTDASTSRLETDLHRIVGRLDELKSSFDKVASGAQRATKGMDESGKSAREAERIYHKLKNAALSMGRDTKKSSDGMVKGMGFLSMGLLSGSRIMKAFSHNMVDGLSLMSAEFWVLSMAARTAYRAIMFFPTKAIKAVDEFRLSVIKTQALITTFAPKEVDFGVAFKEARDYARSLVSELDLMAAYTLGSSFDLQAITQEFMKQGVLLDVNNEKARSAFLNIANAIEIIASGFQAAELQIRQEARALASGQVDLRATLATELNARLGGRLKENVALWKQEDSFVVNIGEQLKGYAASLDDIRNTWKSISALYKTMTDRVIRFGSEEFYDKVNKKLRAMTDYLQKNEVVLSTGVYRGWLLLTTAVNGFIGKMKLLDPYYQKMKAFFTTWASGMEQFLVGMLPGILNNIIATFDVLVKEIVYLVYWTDNAKTMFGELADMSGWIDFTWIDKLAKGEPLPNWNFAKTREGAKKVDELGNSIFEASAKIKTFDQMMLEGGEALEKYYRQIDEFKEKMKNMGKATKTPTIMPQVDREKFQTELDTFLNSSAAKTESYLENEKKQIEEQARFLINQKKLILRDTMGSNIAGIFQQRDFAPARMGPTVKEIAPLVGIFNDLKEAGVELNKELDKFVKDVDTIKRIKTLELDFEMSKRAEEPGKAITSRWGTSIEKKVQELNDFIRDQKHKIEILSAEGILNPEQATKLLTGLDENASKDVERFFDDFNREILSKQIASRRHQIDMAESTFGISRSDAARERLSLSQQELDIELRRLDLLDSFNEKGTEAWNSQIERVEELRNKIVELDQTVRETSGSFGEGVEYEINKFLQNSESSFEFGSGFVQDAASNMTSFLSSTFDDFRNADMKGWQEYLKNLVNVFAEAAQKILVQMAVIKMFEVASSFFTAGTSTTTSSGGAGGFNQFLGNPGAAAKADVPTIGDNFYKPIGIRKVSSSDFSSEREVIAPVINFNIDQPMDAYTFDSYVKRNSGSIRKVVADGIDQSRGYNKKLRGK